MKQASFYNTQPALLAKTFCLLTEKVYNNGNRAMVITYDAELQESLNQSLWTYSKKQFIPHGSQMDPLPSKQPIYITHQNPNSELSNINNANVLIFVNAFDSLVENISKFMTFERVIVVYSLSDEDTKFQLQQLIDILNAASIEMSLYKQNELGAWVLE